ncbi:translin family protein [Candidatus Bathyarchaeota archaeon]|nr:translin family protein [Candidatus Bathyarchaeota archaeon]
MLQEIIKKVTEHLRALDEAKDGAYPKARKARTLSKQSILMLHKGEPEKAQRLISEAANLLTEVRGVGEAFPGIQSSETVVAALQEYAEAAILHSLITEKKYPTPEELGVEETDYVLGLADVTGELRRQALDHLRAGDLEAAERNLETMEEIYLYLIEAEETSMMLKGMRRKLDVARGVIERTRAEITAEAGRRRLSRELGAFRDRLES